MVNVAQEDFLGGLKQAKINRKMFMEEYLQITTKEADIIPFKMNNPQERFYNLAAESKKQRKPVRIIILKARQMGFSTVTGATFYSDTILTSNKKTVVVAHEDDATTAIFNMYKRFNRNMPVEFKHDEKANNAKMLIFDTKDGTGIDSTITCKTASGDSIGASQTIHNLHLSEFGLWKGDIDKMYASIIQCVPHSPNSMVVIESTARGFNSFYDMCIRAQNGENGYTLLFVGWWEMQEYRLPYTGFTLTEKEEAIKAKYNLDNDQLEWRRWCISANCLGKEQIFNQEYPGCIEDAFISSGDNFFDNVLLSDRKRVIENLKPDFNMEFTYDSTDMSLELKNIRQKKFETGKIKVYTDVERRVPYVIGVDTAGDGSDKLTAQVINNMTGQQVAMMSCQLGERKFVEQLYCLGKYYNWALIAIETNFSTYPCQILERMEYPNMYIREIDDDYTGRLKKSYGFRTTGATRQPMLEFLRDTIESNLKLIVDISTINEMITFVKNPKKNDKPMAIIGQHDDKVMALGIAHYCRNQQTAFWLDDDSEKAEEDIFKWPAELTEDNEDNEEKGAYLEWWN